jgi:EAL domain-containing protein (putative c-di-GMP-specific phosphodiesterase class I)
VVPIGIWALRTACIEALNWRGVRVNVNMSQRQLQTPGIVDRVSEVLTETRLAPEQLILEVTESMVMENSEQAIQTLHDLKSLGVTLSLDDFGTGYSSLSYLQRLPVDGVKIDRSFVMLLNREEEPTPIILAMTAMAAAMGLSITGEGVETEEQLQRLHELGCQYGQGYLFAKPLPADGVRTYIQAGRRHRAA